MVVESLGPKISFVEPKAEEYPLDIAYLSRATGRIIWSAHIDSPGAVVWPSAKEIGEPVIVDIQLGTGEHAVGWPDQGSLGLYKVTDDGLVPVQ